MVTCCTPSWWRANSTLREDRRWEIRHVQAITTNFRDFPSGTTMASHHVKLLSATATGPATQLDEETVPKYTKNSTRAEQILLGEPPLPEKTHAGRPLAQVLIGYVTSTNPPSGGRTRRFRRISGRRRSRDAECSNPLGRHAARTVRTR